LKLPQGEVHDFSGEVQKFSGEVQIWPWGQVTNLLSCIAPYFIINLLCLMPDDFICQGIRLSAHVSC
jgi:hypothetical protein